MLSTIAKLEVQVAEKVGQFLIPTDTPLPSVKEMLFQMLKYCGQLEDQAKANEEAAKAKEQEAAPAVEQNPMGQCE